jgi:hypothetical protein
MERHCFFSPGAGIFGEGPFRLTYNAGLCHLPRRIP